MPDWFAREQSLAVWELTLGCNLFCSHCGSAAGKQRANELSTSDALRVVEKLADRGIGEVVLIGGEATLRPDWQIIARAIVAAHMRLTFQTGGYHIDSQFADKIVSTGASAVGVSIDGLEETHAKLRGRPKSFRRALKALDCLHAGGIPYLGVNTQINRANFKEIPHLLDILCAHHVQGWMLAPTIPMGAALADAELCLQPYDFEAIHELVAILSTAGLERNVAVIASNALGYFGPYERLMRSQADLLNFYSGCPAGRNVLGIEANGVVKGCPSLATDLFATGSILGNGLQRLDEHINDWQSAKPTISKNIYRPTVNGFCKECPFAITCKAGCTWAASSINGERGDNPYCMFRSIAQNSTGNQESMHQLSANSIGSFTLGKYTVTNQSCQENIATKESLSAMDPDSIDWPSSLKSIAAEFSSYRQKVREEVIALILEFNDFPTYHTDLPNLYLKRLERRCLPPRAANLMANKTQRPAATQQTSPNPLTAKPGIQREE